MANVLLVSYDNDSHIPFFPINLAYLAASLKQAGHTVGGWLQDIHHGREEALTEILDTNPIDVVGLGFCGGYYQYAKAKKISQAVNAAKRRGVFRYVLGGHGPGADPEFFLEKMGADTVIVGDGEKAIRTAAHGKKGVIQGEPWTKDEGPIEVYESPLFPLMIYRMIRWPTSSRSDLCFPILSSRGCKWNCSFCYRMREGYHERAVPAIMEEVKWLYEHLAINHFQFADELLMGSEERTAEICEAILKLNFKIKWDCNGRLNYATPKVLESMKKAGCSYVNYGIESLDQKILNQMGKGLTLDRIYQGVEDTVRYGLSPGLNFLWGFPGDTVENLFAMVKFIKNNDPGHELRTIRPVTPYPGCRLFGEAVEKGLLTGTEDFYERVHKNSDLISVNFMDISLKEAHESLCIANIRLLNNYVENSRESQAMAARSLYLNGDVNFRGFRAV